MFVMVRTKGETAMERVMELNNWMALHLQTAATDLHWIAQVRNESYNL